MQQLIWIIFKEEDARACGTSPGSTLQNYLAEIKGVWELTVSCEEDRAPGAPWSTGGRPKKVAY